MLVVVISVSAANPIYISYVDIINEFQVGPTNQEQIELRRFSGQHDTLQYDTIPLLGSELITPGGWALVDSEIYLPPMGYTIIDRSILYGSFSLPDDSGWIYLLISIPDTAAWDTVFYPEAAPAPPVDHSAAKFGCWGWYEDDDTTYYRIIDWYIDATPSFGEPNDNYPGCMISGNVYDYYGAPLSNAQIVATKHEEWPSGGVIHPPQYPLCCTTYTASDGAYSIDSLLPLRYDVIASHAGYVPETLWTETLHALKPLTNLDFHLSLGISENTKGTVAINSYVYPNPFSSTFTVVLSEPCAQVKVFDVAGKLCSEVNNQSLSSTVKIDCVALPRGIYFVSTPKHMLKVVKR